MASVLYVYAVTREAVTPECEAVDGSRRYGTTTLDAVCAVFTPVDAEEFSQDVIDRRASDLDWLGAIGYRHQAVMAELMKATAIVPLRAFTLFSSEQTLRGWLGEQRELLAATLDRLDGMQEWTLRIELEPRRWNESLTSRIESLATIVRDAEVAPPGKAFLLRKKLEEEKKRASRTAEENLVAEIERRVLDKLRRETVAESRERRGGAFPQISVLVPRDEEAILQELHAELAARYAPDGVTLALSGPWPPYTFAQATPPAS